MNEKFKELYFLCMFGFYTIEEYDQKVRKIKLQNITLEKIDKKRNFLIKYKGL